MIPKRIELENFLSFGCPAVEFKFDDGEPLWVLAGPNGVGKSAVFDAITFALFGCHRGGKQQMEQLVRHGANGFRVVFEFGFTGTDYRVTRTWSKKPTHRVDYRSDDGEWSVLQTAGTTGQAVTKWVESLIGVNYEAFTASVLLRQGDADRILTVGGTKRLELLKTIIGAGRFEGLSRRVHEATSEVSATLKSLRSQRDDVTPVAAEELVAAESSLAEVETARAAAVDAAQAAAERVPLAKQWAELAATRTGLESRLREADARRGDAARIRERHARFTELYAVVPVLQKLVALRQAVADAEFAAGRLSAERDSVAAALTATTAAAEDARKKAAAHNVEFADHDRGAKRLREQIDRDGKLLKLADEVAGLDTQLAGFAADLPERVAHAAAAEATARGRLATAREEKAVAAGLLDPARAKQRKFSAVGTGMPCSECGQLVSAEHAEKERTRLAEQVEELTGRIAAADQALASAAEAVRVTEAERRTLADQLQRRDRLADQLADRQSTLADLGATADPAGLRAELDRLAADATRHESARAAARRQQTEAVADADRLYAEAQGLADNFADVTNRLTASETLRTSERARAETLSAQLPDEWKPRAASLTPAAANGFADEWKSLDASDVAATFAQLLHDDARRDGWAAQLAEADAALERIPAEARVPVAEVERAAVRARNDVTAADAARDRAKAAFGDLSHRANRLRELAGEVRAAERRHDIHARLDAMLGKNGLQRELVRVAEREIVRHANETARNLSAGDLSIELAACDPDAATEQALDLVVRRAADPEPIGVSYLSGSQRFRVAVAVAVAVGRFASGELKPLRSVIIDEGFGSLDRDGLAAMADELHRLKGCADLERIVLVSHQDEFADQFPVGYRLTPGEAGTTATAFRR